MTIQEHMGIYHSVALTCIELLFTKMPPYRYHTP